MLSLLLACLAEAAEPVSTPLNMNKGQSDLIGTDFVVSYLDPVGVRDGDGDSSA